MRYLLCIILIASGIFGQDTLFIETETVYPGTRLSGTKAPIISTYQDSIVFDSYLNSERTPDRNASLMIQFPTALIEEELHPDGFDVAFRLPFRHEIGPTQLSHAIRIGTYDENYYDEWYYQGFPRYANTNIHRYRFNYIGFDEHISLLVRPNHELDAFVGVLGGMSFYYGNNGDRGRTFLPNYGLHYQTSWLAAELRFIHHEHRQGPAIHLLTGLPFPTRTLLTYSGYSVLTPRKHKYPKSLVYAPQVMSKARADVSKDIKLGKKIGWSGSSLVLAAIPPRLVLLGVFFLWDYTQIPDEVIGITGLLLLPATWVTLTYKTVNESIQLPEHREIELSEIPFPYNEIYRQEYAETYKRRKTFYRVGCGFPIAVLSILYHF